MKKLLPFITILFCFSAWAAQPSKLVDVDKNSKLSDYFKKINGKKVSDNSEEKPLKKFLVDDSETETQSEDQIPLQKTKKAKGSTEGLSPLNKMVIAIVALLFMAVGSLALAQKMGKNKGHTSIAKNIKVLTQKPIGPKKNLMLIRVAGETILLGVTDHNINHIKTLSLMEDELPSYTEPKFKNQLQEKIEQTRINDHVEEVDGFAVSRLDDVKKAVSERFMI